MTDVGSAIQYAGAIAGAFGSVAGLCALITNLITRDVKRDVKEVAGKASDLKHSTNNIITQITALQRQRNDDVERIIKLETAVHNIDRSLERMEKGQDKLGLDIANRFDLLAESIREIRSVSPRP